MGGRAPCGSESGGWSGFARAGSTAREREEERPAGRAVGVRAAVGAGACRAGRLAHRALPQGRILLGPEGVPLRRVDVLASNGVIHMLEGVLLPPTILPILPKLCSEEQHQIVAVSCRLACGPGRTCSPPAGGEAAGGPGAWSLAPGTHLPPPEPGLSSLAGCSFEITPASSGSPALPPATIASLPHSALPHGTAFAFALPSALAFCR